MAIQYILRIFHFNPNIPGILQFDLDISGICWRMKEYTQNILTRYITTEQKYSHTIKYTIISHFNVINSKRL